MDYRILILAVAATICLVGLIAWLATRRVIKKVDDMSRPIKQIRNDSMESLNEFKSGAQELINEMRNTLKSEQTATEFARKEREKAEDALINIKRALVVEVEELENASQRRIHEEALLDQAYKKRQQLIASLANIQEGNPEFNLTPEKMEALKSVYNSISVNKSFPAGVRGSSEGESFFNPANLMLMACLLNSFDDQQLIPGMDGLEQGTGDVFSTENQDLSTLDVVDAGSFGADDYNSNGSIDTCDSGSFGSDGGGFSAD